MATHQPVPVDGFQTCQRLKLQILYVDMGNNRISWVTVGLFAKDGSRNKVIHSRENERENSLLNSEFLLLLQVSLFQTFSAILEFLSCFTVTFCFFLFCLFSCNCTSFQDCGFGLSNMLLSVLYSGL